MKVAVTAEGRIGDKRINFAVDRSLRISSRLIEKNNNNDSKILGREARLRINYALTSKEEKNAHADECIA